MRLGFVSTSYYVVAMLSTWLNGKRKAMLVSIPKVCPEPSNHFAKGYFCITNLFKFLIKN